MAVRRLCEKVGNCLVLGQITGIKLVILALFGDQLVVAAALDDAALFQHHDAVCICLLYTSPSPRDGLLSRVPSSA